MKKIIQGVTMKKIKYEKPMSVDAGQVAAIQGATCATTGAGASDGCSTGNNAYPGGCNIGNDPTTIPYCPAGSIATGNCYPSGGTADNSCHDGGTPKW